MVWRLTSNRLATYDAFFVITFGKSGLKRKMYYPILIFVDISCDVEVRARLSSSPLSFLFLIILKVLTFSYTLLSVGTPSRKTSAIRVYDDEEKITRKILHLQDTTKTSIKTMEISSLLNTDLGNWNDSSFI